MGVDELLAREPAVRGAAFAAVFALVATWEALDRRRRPQMAPMLRRANNLALFLINTLVVRLAFPAAAVGAALAAERGGWGLFNGLTLPPGPEAVLSILLLDFAVWIQHLAFHAVPVLWRLHRVHHTDIDVDVTTGLRFHPLEILLSMLFKIVVVTALGAPAIAVLVFEVLLNATSMFSHGNLRLAAGLDQVLRWLVVTPDMHRVHHSWHFPETNSNFGFNLPWWDRLFGTYVAQPRDGHEAMTLGLRAFREPADLRLDRMLLQPLDGRAANDRQA